jgi:hypothetical protein
LEIRAGLVAGNYMLRSGKRESFVVPAKPLVAHQQAAERRNRLRLGKRVLVFAAAYRAVDLAAAARSKTSGTSAISRAFFASP